MNTFLPVVLWGFGIERGAALGRSGTPFNFRYLFPLLKINLQTFREAGKHGDGSHAS
jgi:hypothetical protein